MDLLVYNSSVVLKDLTEERAMMIAKILALTIFIVMFVLIITDKIEKCLVTLCCGLATAVLPRTAGEVLESVLHLFAHILLASFPRYFRKMLGNPQRISSAFPFISQKI